MPTQMMKKTNVAPITWPEAVELYESHLRAKRAGKRTIEGYLFELDYLRDYLDRKKASVAPGSITVDRLREYICGLMTGEASRRGKPLAAGTVARVATTLAGFFEFLHEEKRIEDDPARRLERPNVPRYVPGDVL